MDVFNILFYSRYRTLVCHILICINLDQTPFLRGVFKRIIQYPIYLTKTMVVSNRE